MTEPGLRERKKARTRQQIQDAALTLISAKGYDATTVEQIAEAAEVSPSTFFRYFSTKEDVVVSDDYDPAIVAGLEEPDTTLTPVQAFRAVTAHVFGEIYATDQATLLRRVTLLFETPALRNRVALGTREAVAVYGGALARRYGLEPDDRRLAMAVAAIMAVLSLVIEEWAAASGRGDLPAMIDDALAHLQGGLVITTPDGRPS